MAQDLPQRRATAGADREERPRRSERREPREGADRRVLALREDGRSYSAIAREVGLKRSTDAQSAFVRAVRDRPETERREILARESQRLDLLEKRVRERDRAQPATMERRLAALGKLREELL